MDAWEQDSLIPHHHYFLAKNENLASYEFDWLVGEGKSDSDEWWFIARRRKLTLLWCQRVTWYKAEGQQRKTGADEPHDVPPLKQHLTSPGLCHQLMDEHREKEKSQKVKFFPRSVCMPPSLLTVPTAAHYAWLLNRHWCIFMSQSQLIC